MPRKRFRWTRASYRKAQHLSRLLGRMVNLPDRPPLIVERYWELWSEWESSRGYQDRDPLTVPLSRRLAEKHNAEDSIPF